MSEPLLEPIPFGRYQLVERIAVGGMAEIFKAKTYGAHGFEKTLAVKRILPQLAVDPEFVDMFINEARLMVKLAHPKIVQVLDFGQVNGQYFMAMEHVNGLDALGLLRICARHRCRPTTGIAVHIAADVLDALDYAHNTRDDQGRPLGIIHRDISPSNIIVSELGEVKLGDFGIAHVHSRRLHSETGALKGKYGYMSPEMVNGAPVDHRSDIFSVAVVLAELLMVRRLFVAKSELEVLLQVRDARLDRLDKYGRHIPSELRRILEAGLTRDPALRYQDAASFRDALHHFLFEQKRMIRPIELRSFLGRLRDLEKQEETPTLRRVPAAAAPEADAPAPPVAGEPHAPTAVTSPGGEYSARTRERIQVKQKASPVTAGEREEAAPPGLPAVARLARPAADAPAPPRAEPDFAPAAEPPDLHALAALAGDSHDTPSIGLRRKILLGPPPRQAPPAPPDAGEIPRLEAEDMLTALTELEGSGSSSHDFRGAEASSRKLPAPDPQEAVTPGETMKVAAVQVAQCGSLPSHPDLAGELRDLTLARLLFGLATDEETGLLVLRHGDLIKEIYLVDGDPQYITSNLADELFGQYLVHRGIISEGELAMALAMLPRFQGKLGNVMVALKLMRPVEVLRHLTHQVRFKLLNAFAWQTGSYAYYRGRTCALEAAPLGLEAFEIIGAGVNELPEPVLMARLQPLLTTSLRSVSPPPLPPEVFRLGERPRQVFDQLDGRHTVEELLGRFDDPEQRIGFARMLHLLVESGLATRS